MRTIILIRPEAARQGPSKSNGTLMARRPGTGPGTTEAQARDLRPDLGLRGWSG
jgi:hypothetical protein